MVSVFFRCSLICLTNYYFQKYLYKTQNRQTRLPIGTNSLNKISIFKIVFRHRQIRRNTNASSNTTLRNLSQKRFFGKSCYVPTVSINVYNVTTTNVNLQRLLDWWWCSCMSQNYLLKDVILHCPSVLLRQ